MALMGLFIRVPVCDGWELRVLIELKSVSDQTLTMEGSLWNPLLLSIIYVYLNFNRLWLAFPVNENLIVHHTHYLNV